MKRNILIKDYKPSLNLIDTEITIKLVKDTFERKLAEELGLIRVSAPLFVEPQTGLNDNLTGVEKAVSFKSIELGYELEVVQSLAKWKRNALKMYNFKADTGLYTDMNAIRPFEELDNIHSIYVDQWDWEKVITKEDRNEEYLKETVRKIYRALKETSEVIKERFPKLEHNLPENITFITTEELEDLYPNLSRKDRENEITKKYGAVFLMRIGHKLKDGMSHDGRAADYDDWSLNGDILLWYDLLNIAFEISSMGIRVDKDSLLFQLKEKKEEYKIDMPYHQDIINEKLQEKLAVELQKRDNYNLIYESAATRSKLDITAKPMMRDIYVRLLDDLLRENKESPIFTQHIDYINKSYYKRTTPYEENEPNSIVVDYIAGMTDNYFIELHRHLFPESDYKVEYKGYFD